jgi:hypothetical protein
MTNNKINKLKNIIQLYTNLENITNNKLAVEWLAKSYVDLLTKLNNEEISLKEFEIQYIKLLEQAKAMHKKEMVMFVLNVMGNYKHGDVLFDVATKLYTETYEGGNK